MHILTIIHIMISIATVVIALRNTLITSHYTSVMPATTGLILAIVSGFSIMLVQPVNMGKLCASAVGLVAATIALTMYARHRQRKVLGAASA